MNNLVIFLYFVMLLAFLLCFVFFKKNVMNLGVIVVGVYFLISLNCLRCLATGKFEFVPQLMFYPYLLFFIIFLILVNPLCKDNNYIKKLKPLNVKNANLIATGYIIAGLLYLFLNVVDAVQLYLSGDFLSRYIEMRGDEAVFYNGFIEQVLVNVVNYFRIPMVLYAFYVYSKNIVFKWKILLLFMPLLTTGVFAVLFSSRTDLVLIMMIYVVSYILFNDYLQLRIKRLFKKIAIIVGFVVFSVLLAISVSRFGDSDLSWINEYFGFSFITAHNLIGYTTSYSGGSIFFGYIMDMFGYPRTGFRCLIDNGVSFTTLIGIRFADFGFWGTLLYAVIASLVLSSIVRKKTIDFGDVVIIVYYFQCLFMGVFYDASNAISWITMIIISVIYKLLCKPLKHLHQR